MEKKRRAPSLVLDLCFTKPPNHKAPRILRGWCSSCQLKAYCRFLPNELGTLVPAVLDVLLVSMTFLFLQHTKHGPFDGETSSYDLERVEPAATRLLLLVDTPPVRRDELIFLDEIENKKNQRNKMGEQQQDNMA